MRQLIIATGNAHKTEEFAELLAASDFEVQSALVCGGMPDVDENGSTFAENAELKSRALYEIAPKDSWVLSDDSGLEVDALNGAPGIFSARFAGPQASDQENLEKLLRDLSDVPKDQRTARFRCALCLIDPHGKTYHFDGTCEGRISESATGSSGFGYDPLFVPVGYDKSFADLGQEVKSQLSHRARALAAMLDLFIL